MIYSRQTCPACGGRRWLPKLVEIDDAEPWLRNLTSDMIREVCSICKGSGGVTIAHADKHIREKE